MERLDDWSRIKAHRATRILVTLFQVPLLPVAVMFAAFTGLALLTPLNHDEGQFVAAAHLVGRGLLPYRDFPYLQTPLQPLLLGPVTWLVTGWNLLALRLVNALCIALAILLIGRAARALTDRRGGFVAMLLTSTTVAVVVAGTQARNDALPFLLFAGALERLLTSGRDLSPARGLLIGLLLSAAASTKLSYALPAAAVGLGAIARARDPAQRTTMIAVISGEVIGVLPTLVLALFAPSAFLFQVYHYSIDAVQAWSALRGDSWRLLPPIRLAEWTLGMAQGPLLILLVGGLLLRVRRGASQTLARLPIWLGPIVLAAVLASLLPMPSLRHYSVPLAAPLILWFLGLGWPYREDPGSRRAIRLMVLVIAGGVGIAAALTFLPGSNEDRPLMVEAQAHRLGKLARRAGATNIATLEPVRAVDSGVPLDPRFATGQFLFRAGNVEACASSSQRCPITFASLARLTERPPGAVVTGTQRKRPDTIPGGLDGLLDRWARTNGYRRIDLSPRVRLWLPPLVAQNTDVAPGRS